MTAVSTPGPETYGPDRRALFESEEHLSQEEIDRLLGVTPRRPSED